MDTTMFLEMPGNDYMDYITAVLLAVVTIAIITLVSVYVCAGICKRVR